MTNVRTGLAALFFVLFGAGCKSNGAGAAGDSGAMAAASSSGTSAPAPSVAAGTQDAAPPPKTTASKLAACPTTVHGVVATVADTKDGVALTIKAKDAASADEVRERSHAVAELAAHGGGGHGGRGHGGRGGGGGGGGGGGDGNGPSDGTGGGGGLGGGGGGGMGRCPVVMRNVTIDVKDTKDGAILTMTPTRPHDLDSVRNQVRNRLSGD